jgi:hypothetical protein
MANSNKGHAAYRAGPEPVNDAARAGVVSPRRPQKHAMATTAAVQRSGCGPLTAARAGVLPCP